MLTLTALLERLESEERQLRETGYKILQKQPLYSSFWRKEFKEVELPTVYGLERVPAVIRYRFEIQAQGYVLDDILNKPTPIFRHIFDLYVLRSYPFPVARRLGAPVRIVWVSPIFHPNIAPGIESGGTGVVCWRALSKGIATISLYNILQGVKSLVETPNPDDPLRNPPLCLMAAKYFKENPPPKVIKVDKTG